jgi:hypothetical protein
MFEYYFIDIKVYKQKYAEQQVKDIVETIKKLGMKDRAIISSYNAKANSSL